ncbi:O-antigen polymerase [Tenacibaculum finnmarkense]|uniref:O-antigen polymerase n=1 Tax=Tenacibaculum finnmarkense TaxID=2781243 RepID=UPI001E4354AF|nr:O-antigen polymerase [Tenacibaculum finnmarkense]MCD8410899.1 oligosaccharide repeat unit polymerase [Tenacibaculum finnmarkense genomovar ulcerans]
MYIIISFLVLIISYNLFKRAAGSMQLTKLNMISWVFYFNLVIQSFFAAIMVVNKVDDHYLIDKIQDETSRLYGWLAVMYTMLAIPIGMIFVNLFFKDKMSTLMSKYAQKPITSLFSVKDSYIRFPLYILSILSILSILYVFSCLPEIPILKAIKGNASALELAGLRANASRSFRGNVLIRNILGITLTPILTFVFYGYYKKTKSKKDLVIFAIMFFFSFLILTYNLEKSKFVFFLLGFMFLKIIIDGEIQKKILMYFGGITLVLIIVAYLQVAKSTDILWLFSNYNSGILGRIFLSQAGGMYLMFDYFPRVYDFIGVNSLSTVLSTIFDLDHSVRAGRLAMLKANPDFVESSGVLNSLFIGEAWANFGIIGVIIAPLYVGAVIQTLFRLLLSLKKTPIILALLTFFTYKSSITGGINDYFYNMGYLILIIIISFTYLAGKALYIIYSKKQKNYK